MYRKYLKRLGDVALCLLALPVLLPLFLILSLAIRLDSKGPVIFVQKRVGKDKRHFTIYKFRTMKTDAPKEVPTHLIGDPAAYMTRLGSLLRKTSLDELPQLLNIFKGDMSLVGPRPALWNQFDLIAERDKYNANSVRPGLTGWAQINGRDTLEIPVKAKLDGEYVERMSYLFDLRCFFGTIVSIFKREGVVEGGTGALNNKEDKK